MASTIGSLTNGSIIKIKENGILVDFIKTDNYRKSEEWVGPDAPEPQTLSFGLIVRKDAYSGPFQPGQAINVCESYYNKIDSTIRKHIPTNLTDSSLSDDGDYGYDYNGSFALTTSDLGGYFGAYANRACYFNGQQVEWWTGTNRSGWSSYYYVTTSGSTDDSSSAVGYARPAFLLPIELYVTSNGTVATGSPPTNPASITTSETSVMAGTQIVVSWGASLDSDLAGYILERSENEQEPWEQVYSGGYSTTSYTDTAPARSENVSTIRYRVKAYDAEGLESNYVTGNVITVINNVAPSAPGSISASNVVANGSATITWTAATDTDGTIASYTVERKIDGNSFTQIYNGTALTTTDTINEEWGTVQYRVKATDNDGGVSDYTTSTTYTVNSGFLILNGPDFSMGNKTAPFNFEFSISTSDSTTVNDITAIVTLDNVQIYSDTPNTGETVSIPIDTRLLGTGSHVVNVTVSKTDYLGVSYSYTFTIPSFEISDEGIAQQFQNSQGVSIFPVTLARYVIGKNGQDVNTLIGDGLKIKSGYYTGTGTFGSTNLNSLTFDFVPKFLMITNRNNAGFCPLMVYGQPGTYCQVGSTTGYLTTTWGNDSGKTVKWYGTSAELQLNNSGQHYVYVAIG